MRKNEAGYATVAATGMLAALSVMGISYMQLSGASLKVSERTTSQILLDGALEEMLAETITALANGTAQTTSFPQRETMPITQSEIEILVESERDKLSLFSATELELREALSDAGMAHSLVRDIGRRFREWRYAKSDQLDMADILPSGHSAALENCVRATATNFKVPAVYKRPGAKENLDGEILRIRVQETTKDQPARGLEAIVLFTGGRKEPVWVLKWRRYSHSKTEVCSS